MAQSPHIEQNSDSSVSDFQISSQSVIDKIYHNSRTNKNINLKLGPVTKIDKRNTAILIVIFLIYIQFEAMRKQDSGRMVGENYIFINNNFVLQQLKTN